MKNNKVVISQTTEIWTFKKQLEKKSISLHYLFNKEKERLD